MLKHLDPHDMKLEGEGMKLLALQLNRTSLLEYLDLSKNGILQSGARHLAQCLSTLKKKKNASST